MTAAELTEWAAYEQVYGPLLTQDRVDIGLAQVCLILVKLLGKKSKHTLRDFLPSWWQDQLKRSQQDDGRRLFERLMRMAENADH